MAASAVGVNLQSGGASDGLVGKIRFPTLSHSGPAATVRFDPVVLELALETLKSITSGLVGDLQRSFASRRIPSVRLSSLESPHPPFDSMTEWSSCR